MNIIYRIMLFIANALIFLLMIILSITIYSNGNSLVDAIYKPVFIGIFPLLIVAYIRARVIDNAGMTGKLDKDTKFPIIRIEGDMSNFIVHSDGDKS